MNNRKIIFAILGLAFALALGWAAVFYWKNLRGAGPAILPPGDDEEEIINGGSLPLTIPKGFSISLFAKNIPGARVMIPGPLGDFWVSQTSEGLVSLISPGKHSSDEPEVATPVFRDLNRPHGLAFDPQDPYILYIAEEHRISRVRVYSEGEPEKIADLPRGDGHFTRTIAFGPDGRLYVSIGSSCNACRESDDRRAKILSMNKDGSDVKEFARGLRNAVFFTWSEVDGRMWATDNSRDLLGDDIPPDEINIVEQGKNYGWPICYGKNIHDTDFDKNTYIRNPCMEPFEIGSYIDVPAHSAALGITFIPEDASGWPQDYWYDIFVAYHGSWNRTEPTGYKVVRYKLNAEGEVQGMEDFITGWLRDGEAWGRPVDVLALHGGITYVTDDKAGAIYKMVRTSEVGGGGGADDKANLIVVENVSKGALIKSPIEVRGRARGNWFFEASFPVKLLDAAGKEIAIAIAQAEGEWMTTDFVPFKATLNFQAPASATGTLVLEKDNPSGLPEHDDSLIIPIRFR